MFRSRNLLHTVRRAAGQGAVVAVACVLFAVFDIAVPDVALAAPAEPAHLAVKSLPEVIKGLRNFLMGILAAVATLYLVLAGVYWVTAGGDPAQVERGKGCLRNALIGYGLAALAPVFMSIVQDIVGKS